MNLAIRINRFGFLMQKIWSKQFCSAFEIGKVTIQVIKLFDENFQNSGALEIFMACSAPHEMNNGIGFTSFGAKMIFLQFFQVVKVVL